MIIIYQQKSQIFPNPNNAVVYNWDGTLKSRIYSPPLISDLAKERLGNMEYKGPYFTWIDHIRWRKRNEELFTSIIIGFNQEYYEERVFYPETASFGECFDEGKY